MRNLIIGFACLFASNVGAATTYTILPGSGVGALDGTHAAGYYRRQVSDGSYIVDKGTLVVGANPNFDWRGWLTFDLNAFAAGLAPGESVKSVKLKGTFTFDPVPNGSPAFPAGLELFSIESDLASLVSADETTVSQSLLDGYFGDLGDGDIFGGGVADPSCAPDTPLACPLAFDFNAAGLAAFDAALGTGWLGVGMNLFLSGLTVDLYSLEAGQYSLVVETVPLPAAAWLFASAIGLVGFGAARRRTNRL